MKKLIG